MLERSVWDRYLAGGRTHLFHVTAAENVAAILGEGLRPGTELGRTTRADFFQPRPGHVYLVKQADVAVIEVLGEPRVLAVELVHLDPALIDPDEDIVKDHLAGMVMTAPPQREMTGCVELPGQAGRLAEWADGTPDFDRSEITERSLFEHERISYRGSIPAAAITEVDVRSEHLTLFLREIGAIVDHDFGTPPPAGMALTEAARARALAEALVHGLLATVDCADLEVDLSEHDSASRTASRLRGIAAGMRRGDFAEIRRSLVVSAAEAIAEQAAEFDPIVVRFALDGALDIADVCAREVREIFDADVLSAEQAVEIISAAMARVRDVGWRSGVPWYVPE
jgi:hypothetical protein